MEEESEKIYILLTFTGTFLSRVIRIYTRKKYSHVSISLDKDLNRLYSFGRKNAYNPFIGSFIHEGINFGTFKRFKNTKCVLYSLDVSKEEYKKVEEIIAEFDKTKDKYKFNTLGLFLSGLNIDLKRENYYYCSQFSKYVLDNSNIENNLPKLAKPMDFANLENLEFVYEGKLKEYK